MEKGMKKEFLVDYKHWQGEEGEVTSSLLKGYFWICMIFVIRDKVACQDDFLLEGNV